MSFPELGPADLIVLGAQPGWRVDSRSPTHPSRPTPRPFPVASGGVAVNVIAFRLLGLLPGMAMLQGTWRRATPDDRRTLRRSSSRPLSANTVLVDFGPPRVALLGGMLPPLQVNAKARTRPRARRHAPNPAAQPHHPLLPSHLPTLPLNFPSLSLPLPPHPPPLLSPAPFAPNPPFALLSFFQLGPKSRVGLDVTYLDDRLRVCRGAGSAVPFVFRYDTCAAGGPLSRKADAWRVVAAARALGARSFAAPMVSNARARRWGKEGMSASRSASVRVEPVSRLVGGRQRWGCAHACACVSSRRQHCHLI
jgi:hypothetical protein